MRKIKSSVSLKMNFNFFCLPFKIFLVNINTVSVKVCIIFLFKEMLIIICCKCFHCFGSAQKIQMVGILCLFQCFSKCIFWTLFLTNYRLPNCRTWSFLIEGIPQKPKTSKIASYRIRYMFDICLLRKIF